MTTSTLRPSSIRGALLASCLTLVGACSGVSSEGGDPVVDGRRLQEVLLADRTEGVLREADEAVREERPVTASDLIGTAIGSTETVIANIREVPAESPEGRRLRERALRVYRERVVALTRYRDTLARGVMVDDESLYEALHEYRVAEGHMSELFDSLSELLGTRVVPDDAPSADEPQLGGLPSISADGLTPSALRDPETTLGEPPSGPPDDPARGDPGGDPLMGLFDDPAVRSGEEDPK